MESPDREERRDRILEEALDRVGAARAEYVAEACAGDGELRAEVERLLALTDDVGEGFLENPDPQAPASSRAGQRVGRYEIQDEIGAGGAGRVYRARDTQIQRTVALKVMHPGSFASSEQSRARFLRELRMLGAINHENIVQLYDCGEFEGELFLVMEFLAGEDLSHAITGGRCGDTRERLEIARQIVAGLAHIHDQGIIHRDLKPANIFLLPGRRVKLMDFGIAFTEGLNLTTAGTIAGTPAYMAPEQIEGKKLTKLSDVHALGVTLYELFTGERAFASETMAGLFHQVLSVPLRLEPLKDAGVPQAVIVFVARCMEKDAARRPEDIRAEYAAAMQGVTRELPEAQAVAAVLPASQPIDRRRWLYGAGAALGAGALGGGAYRAGLLRMGSTAVRSLAVLPFVNATGDARFDYLSTGLTEGLITSLGYIKGLMVTARSAVLPYQNKTVDPREAGQRLGVEGILTGSIRRGGGAFTVMAELADARSAAHLWGTQQAFKEEELAGAQGRIAQEVAASLGLQPGPNVQRTFQQPTGSSDAYQNYLYGRYSLNKRTLSGYQQAVEYFRRAVEADAKFALAWSGLADAYSFQGGLRPPKDVFPLAKQAVERSLAADNSLAEGHASAGFVHLQYDWDWPAAEREFGAALGLNENDTAARARYARLLLVLGRFAEAEQELLRVQRLDPISLTTGTTLANCYYLDRKYDKAVAQARRVLELEPAFLVAADLMADVLVEQGKYSEAIEIYEKEVASQAEDAGALASLARAAILAKETAKADSAVERFQKLAASKPINPSAKAMVQIALGNHDEAIAHLQEGYRERYWPLIFLKVSPIWDPLRKRPEFENLLKAMNLA